MLSFRIQNIILVTEKDSTMYLDIIVHFKPYGKYITRMSGVDECGNCFFDEQLHLLIGKVCCSRKP